MCLHTVIDFAVRTMLINVIVKIYAALGSLLTTELRNSDTNVLRTLTGVEPYHGFVINPPSRAYFCQTSQNVDCGAVKYEPQSIECHKNFPAQGPPDGQIASCAIDRFGHLDEYGPGRWKQVNLLDYITVSETAEKQKRFSLTLDWYYTMVHVTAKYELFATKRTYNPNKMPLTRDQLKLVGTVESTVSRERVTFVFDNMDDFFESGGILLAVWTIGQDNNAFYQVIDYRMGLQLSTPPTSIDLTTLTTTGKTKAPTIRKHDLFETILRSRSTVVKTSGLPGVCPRLDTQRCLRKRYVINPCNCHEFYYCQSKRNIITMSCPGDLVYDEENGVCNWETSVILPPDVTCN